MRIFEKPNTANNWKCPICNTAEEKPIVLIGIDGTQRGNIIEGEQFHLDCIDLRLNKDIKLIYQRFDDVKDFENEDT